MNIRQLIEELEDLAVDFGDETEVLIAHQPSWPLAETIQCLTPDASDDDEDNDEDVVVWIAAGGHPYGRSPYAPAAAWDGA